MKKFVVVLLALVMAMSLCMVAGAEDVKDVIAQAETMTLEELAAKAIEESNGKMFYGVGNSSRGKSALPLFIEYLQHRSFLYNGIRMAAAEEQQNLRSADR